MSAIDTADRSAGIDPMELRRTCAAFGTGVTVITTRDGSGGQGMTANAFMSVSLAPPLIVVSVNRRARILPRIEAAGWWPGVDTFLCDGRSVFPSEGATCAHAPLDLRRKACLLYRSNRVRDLPSRSVRDP